MSNSSFFRDRAICAKILAEGTGLNPERMSDRAIREHIRTRLDQLLRFAVDAQLSSPPLVRALVELDALWTEETTRGLQLLLPGV